MGENRWKKNNRGLELLKLGDGDHYSILLCVHSKFFHNMAFWKGTVTSEKPYTHMHHNHCSYIIQGSEIKLTAKQFLGFFFFHIRVTISKGASDSVPFPYQAIKSICMCKSISKNVFHMHLLIWVRRFQIFCPGPELEQDSQLTQHYLARDI